MILVAEDPKKDTMRTNCEENDINLFGRSKTGDFHFSVLDYSV